MGRGTAIASFPRGSTSHSTAFTSRSGSASAVSRKLKNYSGTTSIPDKSASGSLISGPSATAVRFYAQDRSAKSRDQSAHQIIDRFPAPPHTTRPARSEFQNHQTGKVRKQHMPLTNPHPQKTERSPRTTRPVRSEIQHNHQHSTSGKVRKQQMSLTNPHPRKIDKHPEPPHTTRRIRSEFQDHSASSSSGKVRKQQMPLINPHLQKIEKHPEPPRTTRRIRSEFQDHLASSSSGKVRKQQMPLINPHPQKIEKHPEPSYTTRPAVRSEFQDLVAARKTRVAHKLQREQMMPLINPSDAAKIKRMKESLKQLVMQNAQKKARKEARTMKLKINSGRMMMDRSKRGVRMTSSVSMATASRAAAGANDDLMKEEYCDDDIIWCEECDKVARGEPCRTHGAIFYPDIKKPKPCECGERFFTFVPGYRRLSCGHSTNVESSFICQSCGKRITESQIEAQEREDGINVARRSCPFFCEIRESAMLREFAAKAAEAEKPESTLGVFTRMRLPAGVIYGPYKGVEYKGEDTEHDGYSWDIHPSGPGSVTKHVDALDERKSNWLRYINCCRSEAEQNLEAFQWHGKVYYRAFEAIPPNTELLVYYGDEFAEELGIVAPGEEENAKEKEVEEEAKPEDRSATLDPVPPTNEKASHKKRKRVGKNPFLFR